MTKFTLDISRVVRSSMAAFFISGGSLAAHMSGGPPLQESDLNSIARVLMYEDTRTYQHTLFDSLSRSAHPEVRRRLALALGRIPLAQSRALLARLRAEADTAVLADVVFSTGQSGDTSSIGWLATLLNDPATPPSVAVEAAAALGKLRTGESHRGLTRFLLSTDPLPSRVAAIGEALLSLGRFTTRAPLDPIARWVTSAHEEIRWRAAWALFRPRDPAAVAHALRLTGDPSAEVRNWSVRALQSALVDSAGVPRDAVLATLLRLTRDSDRGVQTEAVRALATWPESAAVIRVAEFLRSDDIWLSLSAAEGVARHREMASLFTDALHTATSNGRSPWLQGVALTTLNATAPAEAFSAAERMTHDSSAAVRLAAVNHFRTRGEVAREALLRLTSDRDTTVATAALAAVAALDQSAGVAGAAGAVGGGRAGRAGGTGGGRAAGGGGGGGGGGAQSVQELAHYRRIVDRWVVPSYAGAPPVRVEWSTVRGSFTIALRGGDAPIAAENLVQNIESGRIVGVDFSRVVPDFVVQQRGIAGHPVVRDEVNRHRLTRGNLSWASAGIDTGRPGYTIGHSAQPHNEGGFTSLGWVETGMDVVDRLELGDRIIGARVISHPW